MKKISCALVKISPDDGKNYFFGYYDKCPWNKDGSKLLTHRVGFLDRFPNSGDVAEIGYIDLETDVFKKIAETTAWNWQQGSQLQWLNRNGKEQIIFNQRVDGKVSACLIDPDSRQKEFLNSSIYTVSPKGDFALTLNYARLYDTRRDYGIAGLSDIYANTHMPDKDGIYRVNMTTGNSELLVSIAEIARFNENEMGKHAKHRINHMMFNPMGNRFCFLHRFDRPDGITHSRFFTLGIDGSDMRLLFEGIISHYGWKDENTILAWAGKRTILGQGKKSNPLMTIARKFLKPIYYALGKPRILMQKFVGDSYYLISDSDGQINNKYAIGQLTCDGHCTYSPKGRWFVTDGYTDRNNRLPLYLWDDEKNEGFEIGRFDTPKKLDGEIRVDLHPRFNQDGTKICIDSAMSGYRSIYVVDVSSIVNFG